MNEASGPTVASPGSTRASTPSPSRRSADSQGQQGVQALDRPDPVRAGGERGEEQRADDVADEHGAGLPYRGEVAAADQMPHSPDGPGHRQEVLDLLEE